MSQGWAFDFQPSLFARPASGRRPGCISFLAMSIAVSAVVVPSRLLRRALLCCAAVNGSAAAALAWGAARPSWLPLAGAGACLLAAAAVLAALARIPKMRRIDISGLGQLRLTVQQGIGPDDGRDGPLRLLPGSTLWPGLMLLRLQDEHGRVSALVLLPDSVEPGQFRRLAVAIRHVAARKT